MDKRFWGILIVIVIIFGGIFWATSNKNNNSSSSKPTSHIEGQGADSVTLVEYGDYQCPYCGEYYPIVKQIEADYNAQIYFQFRNLPLTQLHPNAFAGARAAEAAALQGKFWQMHDLLYETNEEYYADTSQPSWISSTNPESYFQSFAQQLGLNVSQFEQDYSSTQVNNSINADLTQFGIDYKAATGAYNPNQDEATPTFFLNGKHITPTESLASFETYINAAIKAKGFTPPVISSSSAGSSSAPQSTQ